MQKEENRMFNKQEVEAIKDGYVKQMERMKMEMDYKQQETIAFLKNENEKIQRKTARRICRLVQQEFLSLHKQIREFKEDLKFKNDKIKKSCRTLFS